MAIQSISQLKAWFKKNCYPTEGQFADWIDSFWHKRESIPIASITDLTTVLNSKQDKATATDVDVSEIEVFDPAKVGGYLAGNTFVSYKNLASSDVAFHTASIYHCVANAAIGESPETHPAKWENQGTTITYTSSSTCKTHVVLMSELATLTGMKNGDIVGVQQLSQYYKYSTVSGWTFFANFIWDLKQTTGTSTTAVMSQKAVTDAIAAASGGGSGLASTWEANITAIRALTSHNTGNDVGDYATLNIYEYDATLSNADDGDTYLKPDDVSGAGRWFKKKQLALKSETDLCKTEGYKFKALAPDCAIISKPYNFKVSAKTDVGGVATIKTSADVVYVINATVNAYDELKVYGDTIGMKSYLTVEKV